jgi:hypothetical protein
MPADKPYITWDEVEILDTLAKDAIKGLNIDDWMLNGSSFESLWEESGADPEKFLKAVRADKKLDDLEKHLFQKFGEGEDLQWVWEGLLEALNELMQEINPDEKTWFVDASGLGWRGQSGHKFVPGYKSAKEFLQSVLPDTDNTFRIYKDGKDGFTIVNSHHDAMGERYHVGLADDFSVIKKADKQGALEAAAKAYKRRERVDDAITAAEDYLRGKGYNFNSDVIDIRTGQAGELYDAISDNAFGRIPGLEWY